MLACATLIEVHYFIRLLDYSSKTYKSHKQNEDGGVKRREFKRILDSAFDIYLRCDPVSHSLQVRLRDILNDAPIVTVQMDWFQRGLAFILLVS